MKKRITKYLELLGIIMLIFIGLNIGIAQCPACPGSNCDNCFGGPPELDGGGGPRGGGGGAQIICPPYGQSGKCHIICWEQIGGTWLSGCGYSGITIDYCYGNIVESCEI